MSWFNKIKMNEKDFETEEFLDDILEENEEENVALGEETPKQQVKSMRETELEIKLKTETTRREAAEAKLIGVQARDQSVRRRGLQDATGLVGAEDALLAEHVAEARELPPRDLGDHLAE